MNILGIHYGGHDAGACVMVPARQPVAIALERLDRIKYSGCFTKGWREKFPSNLRGLVEYCLRGLGAAPGDIKFDLVLHTILPVEDSQFRALLRPYTETEAALCKMAICLAANSWRWCGLIRHLTSGRADKTPVLLQGASTKTTSNEAGSKREANSSMLMN